MSRLYQTSGMINGIIEDIELSRLKPTSFPLRASIEANDELALSIQQKGLLQPIIVRVPTDESYEIIAGNRRFMACKSLGWRKMPCNVVDLDDKACFEISLIENVQRRSLSVLEEAHSFKKYVNDYGWGGVSELAMKLGKSASYVTKRIQLLELPQDILKSIARSELNPSIADELSSVRDKDKQSAIAEIVTKEKLSFREARILVKSDEITLSKSEIYPSYAKSEHQIRMEKNGRSIDKSIIALRIAMNRLASIIENSNDDMIFEILMKHKNLLHKQIDDLIKERKKIR